MRTRDPIRFWGMTLGVAIFGVALAVVAVKAQPVKPQPAKPQPVAAKAPAAKPPLTDAERKTLEELQAEQKRLDTDSARLMAATPDGQRRVTETIAKHFNVPEKLVSDLRARKLGYGEVTIAVALSQQLMKREKMLTQQQAADTMVSMRKSGQSWGTIARDLRLNLGDVVNAVKKADKQLAKLDTLTTAKAVEKSKATR